MQTVVMSLFSPSMPDEKMCCQLNNCSGNKVIQEVFKPRLQVFNLKANRLFGELVCPSDKKYH